MRFPTFETTTMATLLCVAFSSFGTTAEAAQAPGVLAAQEPAAPSEDAERELKRILHLTNGQALRAIARWKDGRWEYRVNRSWTALPDGFVKRVALEREVLSQMKSLDKGIGDEDLGRRVELARWMVGEGLLEESLNELSRVLEASGNHSGALALLAERHFIPVPSLDVPEDEVQDALVTLFDWAIGMPRAGQELAMLEFEHVKDREGFREDVAKALGSHSFLRRAFAARLLGRLYPGQEVKRLLAHAVLDASSEARLGAADALAAAEEPALTVPVVRALGSKSSTVRQQAAEALGNMNYKVAVQPLMSHLAAIASAQATSGTRAPHSHVFFGRQFAYVQDFDVEVAQFQSIADPQINVLVEGSVQDSAVQASRETVTVVERVAVRNALSELTGANPGKTSKAWLSWWDDNQADWSAEETVSANEG